MDLYPKFYHTLTWDFEMFWPTLLYSVHKFCIVVVVVLLVIEFRVVSERMPKLEFLLVSPPVGRNVPGGVIFIPHLLDTSLLLKWEKSGFFNLHGLEDRVSVSFYILGVKTVVLEWNDRTLDSDIVLWSVFSGSELCFPWILSSLPSFNLKWRKKLGSNTVEGKGSVEGWDAVSSRLLSPRVKEALVIREGSSLRRGDMCDYQFNCVCTFNSTIFIIRYIFPM